MVKTLIYGAGSIGTHLSQAARRMGYQVTVVDTNAEALRRMREEVYPARYGAWDERIVQMWDSHAHFNPGDFDIVMVGTPPDSHMDLALKALTLEPRLLHIEKPLLRPTDDLEAFKGAVASHPSTMVTVGYDHAVSRSFQFLLSHIGSGDYGEVISIDGATREHWEGIFKAHPWLAGPHDSYLGFTERGGGAACEHSHALHLVLTVAEKAAWEQVEGGCVLDMVKGSHGERYDRLASFQLRNAAGSVARVIQDVVTKPTEKYVRVQCEDAVLTWKGSPDIDVVDVRQLDGREQVSRFPKTRRDDFFYLMEHYAGLLGGSLDYATSPLRVETGVEVIKIIKTGI